LLLHRKVADGNRHLSPGHELGAVGRRSPDDQSHIDGRGEPVVNSSAADDAVELHHVGSVHGNLDDVRALIRSSLAPLLEGMACCEESTPDGLQLTSSLGSRASLWLSARARPPRESREVLRAGLDLYEVVVGLRNAPEELSSGFVRTLRQRLQRFSGSERERIRRLNPLVWDVAGSWPKRSLSHVTLVVRDHLLLEKLNLMYALLELGLDPRRCMFLGKEDDSLFASHVVSELRALGVHTLRPTTADDLADTCRRFIELAADGPAIVLDDGGAFIKEFATLSGIEGRPFAFVETTTKGMLNLRTLPFVRFVNDLASCSIKSDLSQQIGVSCVVRLRQILCHEKMTAERCLIMGYGKIGRHVATVLRAIGVMVSVCDVDPAARLAAADAGFPAFSSASEALSTGTHRFIFGCSGAQSVAVSDLNLLPSNAILAGASSQDLMRVTRHLQEVASSTRVDGYGDVYLHKGKRIDVIGHGHAVNLYLAEGVSEPEYDPFTALMLSTILELAEALAVSKQPVRLSVEALCTAVRDRSGRRVAA
jgi:S-adenosylhomocysteine hydrolase